MCRASTSEIGTNWRQQAPHPSWQLILCPCASSVCVVTSTTRSDKTWTRGSICRSRVSPVGMVTVVFNSQSGVARSTGIVTDSGDGGTRESMIFGRPSVVVSCQWLEKNGICLLATNHWQLATAFNGRFPAGASPTRSRRLHRREKFWRRFPESVRLRAISSRSCGPV